MKPGVIIALLYGATFGVYGVIMPFTPIILREMGLPDHQISLAMSMFGLAAIVSPLVISHFADRHLSVRQLTTALMIVNLLTLPCWLSTTTLAIAATIAFLFFATILPVLTLLDAYTVNFAMAEKQNNHRARHYQSYRIWGSIGFVLPSIIVAVISRVMPVDAQVLISIAIVLAIITIFLARLLPANIPSRGASAPSRDALAAALQPPLRGIFTSTTIAGLALSIFYVAFPLYLQELGNSTEAVGLIMNLGVVSEIALMPFTAWLIRLLTARTLILIAIATIPLRLMLITVWPTTEMVVMTQWLHAPLVIGLFVCIPVFLGEAARESYRFSLQSLNSTLVLGVSRLIGPWLGAFLLQNSNAAPIDNLRLVLLTAATLSALSFAVLYISATAPKARPSAT